MRHPFNDPAVAARFEAFAEDDRARLHELRDLIFDIAARTPGVGPLHECLKWNQPAYLTAETGTGTTLRLGTPKHGGAALYVHCQTTLIQDFRTHHPDTFPYEGNRALLFPANTPIPPEPTAHFIQAALTYHVAKR